MRKGTIVLLILSTALLLSACDSQSAYYPKVVDYDAIEAEVEIEIENKPEVEIKPKAEIDLPEDNAHKALYPIVVTVMLNENPVTFEAYEMFGKLFFSLEDLSLAFERTQARFWHSGGYKWRNTGGGD